MNTWHNIFVCGKKGFGKSTWIRRFIFENPDCIYLVYDHFNEYTTKDGDFWFKNSHIFSNVNSFIDYVKNNGTQNGVYIFRGEIEYSQFFLLGAELKNCCIVFDEIDLTCSPSYTDDNLYRIIHYGRHLKTKLISASRRPHNVSRNLTSQADEIICYHIDEPRDLKYVSDYCGEKLAEFLPRLNVGEFVRYPHKKEEQK